MVQESTHQSFEAPKLQVEDIRRVMSEMGRKGGKIGGKRRMVTMTAERRKEIALKAAKIRWAAHANPNGK